MFPTLTLESRGENEKKDKDKERESKENVIERGDVMWFTLTSVIDTLLQKSYD